MGKRIIKYLRYIYNGILDLIYAHSSICLECNRDVEEERILCQECFDRVEFCQWPYNIGDEKLSFQCYSIAFYSRIVKDLIVKFKYKSYFEIGDFFVGEMLEGIKRHNIEFDGIAYVPMSKSKYKSRGYNQSEYMAKALSRHLEKPLYKCLEKQRDTYDQKTLDKDERWSNLQGVFILSKEQDIKNKKILLIDDVITTGATVYFCGKEIIKGGANSVIILTAAKSIL